MRSNAADRTSAKPERHAWLGRVKWYMPKLKIIMAMVVSMSIAEIGIHLCLPDVNVFADSFRLFTIIGLFYHRRLLAGLPILPILDVLAIRITGTIIYCEE